MLNNGMFKRIHQSGAGTPTATGVFYLHTVNVNTAGTSVTIADTTGTIAVIGAVTGCFIYDCAISGTLTITVVGTADVTVSFM